MKKIFGLFVFLITMLILSVNIYAFDLSMVILANEVTEVTSTTATFRVGFDWDVHFNEDDDVEYLRELYDMDILYRRVLNGYSASYGYNKGFCLGDQYAGEICTYKVEKLIPGVMYWYTFFGEPIKMFYTPPDDKKDVVWYTNEYAGKYEVYLCPANLDIGEDKIFLACYKNGKCAYVKTMIPEYANPCIYIKRNTADYAKIYVMKKDSLQPVISPKILYLDEYYDSLCLD